MLNRQKSYRIALITLALLIISSVTFASPWSAAMNWLGLESAATETSQIQAAPALMAPGVCDTAGPIEVESATGTLGGIPTAYATLQLAFAAINGGVLHTGAITIDVCGNTTETVPAVLNQTAGVGTITISPAGGAARTISGAIAAGSPLIDLNGADNVTINGLNTGGNSLTLSNTTIGTTAGSSTIRFIADASTNTVTNCSIQGSSASTLATAAGTVLFSTGTTTGNDNNIVSNNNIGPAGANLPSKAIMASGTSSAIENDNAQITGNNIFDYFLATGSHSAINIITGNEAWTVSSNKFYQTAARVVTTAASRHAAITLNNSTGGFTVSGNTIGFSAANGTGTYTISGTSNEFRGIDSSSVRTTAPATEIQNNIISGINQTSSRASTTTASSAFIAVAMGTTDGLINATGNTVGSLDGSSTIVINETSTTASTAPVVGFYNFSFFNTNVSSNNIGSITIASGGTGTTVGFRGILVNTSSGTAATINNNTIANITDTQVGSYAMYGIQSSLPNLSATGNTVRNMTGSSNGAALIVSSGILASGSTGANTISQNTIHSLSNASGAVANSIYGMSLSLPAAANLVERNFLHSFSLTTTLTGSQIWGISAGATGTTTYQNNMIRLGHDAAGASITLPTSMIGIRDAAGSTNQFYHNTIYIGGSGVLATPTASNSYCFFSDVTTVTRAHLNNIFWNARGNALGGGTAHLATRVGGTTANPPGLTSNYNILYFSGTDGATGVFNATVVPNIGAWRTATGQDLNSIAADPQLINPTGNALLLNLHIAPASPTPIEGAGTLVATVTNDFDNDTRAAFTPVDIGADAGNFIAADLSAPNISYTPLANTTSTANRVLGVTITDTTGVASGANLPRIYFKKSTDGAYVSTQCVMTGGTAQNGTYDCTIDYSLVGGGSVVVNDIIQYFVVAQDTVGNLGSTPGGATGASVNAVTFGGTPNQYTILPVISGNKTVGAGGDYTTLTAAAAAINGAVIDGPTTLTLTDPTYPSETFPIAFNANSGSSAANTLTIKPAPGVSPTISGSSTSCIINLNGADWTTIDGSNTAGGTSRDLTVANTSTGTSSAVICLTSTGVGAGATNDTVKNTNVAGTTVTATAGTLVGIFSGSSTISITSAGADNDSNTIQNNSITRTSYGVYSGGASAANKNTGTVITQNVMNAASPNNITTGGVLVNFDNGAQVSENDISVLKHDGTTGTTNTAFGIGLGVVPNNTVTTFTGSDVTGAILNRNRINGVTQLNSTGYSSFGIVINSVTSGTTLLTNNMVSGVRSPSTASDFSAGIMAGGGTGSTTQMYHNSVSMTGLRGASAAFPSYALAINSGNPTVDVKNNIFSNTQTGGTGKAYAIANASSTFTGMTSNFNDLYVTGANTFVGQTGGLGTAGTDRTTLTDWQTTTSGDAGSIGTDPLFVNPATDLHIQGGPVLSPAAGTGTTGTGVTNDFDLDPRPASAPDMGADELVQAEAGLFPAGTFYNARFVGNSFAGNLTITNTLYIVTIEDLSPFTLTLGCNANVVGAGTNAYLIGDVEKEFCGTGTFTFPVGTPADNLLTGGASPEGNPPEYTPLDVNITAGNFSIGVTPSLTVSVTDDFLTGVVQSNAVSRYWTVEETGDLTADMTIHYLDPKDVNGNESLYQMFKYTTGPFATLVTPNSNDPVANTVTVTGVSSFSDWGAAAAAPTSASASISGRVTTAGGNGIRNATVTISGNSLTTPVTVQTGAFGSYHFSNLAAGETYVVQVGAKRFRFAAPSRVIALQDSIADVDFVANPQE